MARPLETSPGQDRPSSDPGCHGQPAQADPIQFPPPPKLGSRIKRCETGTACRAPTRIGAHWHRSCAGRMLPRVPHACLACFLFVGARLYDVRVKGREWFTTIGEPEGRRCVTMTRSVPRSVAPTRSKPRGCVSHVAAVNVSRAWSSVSHVEQMSQFRTAGRTRRSKGAAMARIAECKLLDFKGTGFARDCWGTT